MARCSTGDRMTSGVWKRIIPIAIALIGPVAALWVWTSALSFVPVPWPDDSAFYFVAKELFRWPPHWVMLPQAPFEPTYRIWNFNTMPLYPILIGLGRFIGIDGSFAIKFWPLSFWALSGSFFGVVLYRAGLPALLSALFALALAMDPAMRWASVLVRPESLIGLMGIILVTGLSLGWFRDPPEARSDSLLAQLWDPIAALLAIGAYAHFNAIHLLFALIPVLIFHPRRMIDVSLKTSFYLFPWILTVALKPRLFFHQMTLQWSRLAVPNGWLHSVSSALKGLFQNLGSPEDWPPILHWTAAGLWALIFVSVAAGIFYPLGQFILQWRRQKKLPRGLDENPSGGVSLLPAAGWVVGAFWLWNSKPEVWFVYYLHIALWTFAGLATLKAWKAAWGFRIPATALAFSTAVMTGIFLYVNLSQAAKLGASRSWKWETYHEFVSCIDRQLVELQAKKGRDLKVWAPTFPDVTIELSRKHPDWDLSRTNDFYSRTGYALKHGMETDAVVVTETLNWAERDIDAPWSEHAEVHSVWMDWKGYYLNSLSTLRGWKQKRHLCQKGRWQAFIYME